jgi:hypothetical protein
MLDATLTPDDAAWPHTAAPEPLARRIERHLIGVIERTPVIDAPFQHMVLDGLWPAADYPALLRALPADAFYRPLKHSDALLPDGRSARLQFPLLPENIERLPPGPRAFWMDVAQAVCAPRVMDAWKRRFAPVLERVAGRPVAGIRLRPYATLFRDIGGYRISIHPDSPRKAITTSTICRPTTARPIWAPSSTPGATMAATTPPAPCASRPTAAMRLQSHRSATTASRRCMTPTGPAIA